MIKLFRSILVILLLVAASTLFASDGSNVSVEIALYNKKIYYLNSTDAIQVRVTVRNNSTQPFRFKAADNRVFHVDFEVKTPANILLDHSQQFIMDRGSFQYVLFREMTLQPGEEYGFIVPLDGFVIFDEPGVFAVMALFYPDLIRSESSMSIPSNIINLSVRPAISDLMVEELIEEETGEIAVREILPPDEVVNATIMARQRSQWEKFFLYLNIEKLLLENPTWRKRYEPLSEQDRLSLQEEYKSLLKLGTIEEDIVVVPNEFSVLKTSYTETEATVSVQMKFFFRDFTEVKRYVYYLERVDSYWMIKAFDVYNLGTE